MNSNGNWSNELLIKYLHGFWDWESSEYIKEKLLKKNGLHKRYVLRRQRAIENYWQTYFSPQLKITDITKADLKKFILSFSDKTSPTSAGGKNDVIRSGLLPLKYAYENQLIPIDITIGLRLFSDETPERFVLDQEIVAELFNTPWKNSVAELANKLAFVTGLRAGEIQALRQCDLLEDAIKIEHSWNFRDGLKVTKSRKSRIVFIPFTDIMLQLTNLANSNPFASDGTGYIFYATIPNKPQEGTAWLYELRKELKNINLTPKVIKQATFHGWRHFFTTHMRRDGYLDDKLIQQITGHKTLEMLNHYSNHTLSEDADKIAITTKRIFEPILMGQKTSSI